MILPILVRTFHKHYISVLTFKNAHKVTSQGPVTAWAIFPKKPIVYYSEPKPWSKYLKKLVDYVKCKPSLFQYSTSWRDFENKTQQNLIQNGTSLGSKWQTPSIETSFWRIKLIKIRTLLRQVSCSFSFSFSIIFEQWDMHTEEYVHLSKQLSPKR